MNMANEWVEFCLPATMIQEWFEHCTNGWSICLWCVTSSLQYLFLLLVVDSVYIWISPEFTLNAGDSYQKSCSIWIYSRWSSGYFLSERGTILYAYMEFFWKLNGIKWYVKQIRIPCIWTRKQHGGHPIYQSCVMNIIRLTWTFILALYMYYTLYLNSLRLINISMVKIIILFVQSSSLSLIIQNFLIKIRVNYISFITHTYSFIYFFIW